MTHTRVPKIFNFSLNDVEITKISSGKLVAIGIANHHAKAYDFSQFVTDANPTALMTHGNELSILWHEIFGHLNFKYLQKIQKKSMVEGLPAIKTSNGICKGCIVDKHLEHKFDRGKASYEKSILGMIHYDISGPIPTTSMNGSQYVLTSIDDFSRYTWVFCIKKKSEVLDKFVELKALVENASGGKIKYMRYDN